MAEIKIKSKKCKVCGDGFVPKRSTLEQVCSIDCAIILGKSKVKKEILAKNKKETSILREKLKTITEWHNDLQREINLIVRTIDLGHPCISSQRPLGKSFDAGHLYGRQSNPHIRYHLFNIFAQSVHDNQWKSGNPLDFVDGIEKTFGKEVKEYCLSLKGLESIKLSVEEIKNIIPLARGIVKYLKLQDRKFTTEERISLRKEFNKTLGIYEKTN